MFCFHKWGAPDANRYQTCTKCGKFRVVECAHVWETIEVSIRNPHIGADGSPVNNGKIYTVRCKHCGEIDNRRPSYY